MDWTRGGVSTPEIEGGLGPIFAGHIQTQPIIDLIANAGVEEGLIAYPDRLDGEVAGIVGRIGQIGDAIGMHGADSDVAAQIPARNRFDWRRHHRDWHIGSKSTRERHGCCENGRYYHFKHITVLVSCNSERGPVSEARAAVKANEGLQITLKGHLIGAAYPIFWILNRNISKLTIH